MNFGEKLQRIRKDKGLSQEKLAEVIGVSRQAVAKWELGQACPDVENLIHLSNLFKISIDKLVKSDEYDNNLIEHKGEKIYEEDMIGFLRRAKIATYAGHGAEVKSSRQSSHDLEYSEGEYNYYDTYLGGEKFSGEEAVWYQGIPLWCMNYSGRVLEDQFSGDFLKEALRFAPEDKPYRGPILYQKGDYLYHSSVNGSFDWYQGYEEIFCEGKKIYECYYHGGVVK